MCVYKYVEVYEHTLQQKAKCGRRMFTTTVMQPWQEDVDHSAYATSMSPQDVHHYGYILAQGTSSIHATSTSPQDVHHHG